MSFLNFIRGGAADGAQPTPTPAPAPDNTPQPEGLDKFLDLVEAKVTPEDSFDPTKLFNVDPAKLQEEVSKMDFLTGSITKDQLEKLRTGGEDSVGAMLEVMQNVARKAFMQSAALSTSVTTNALSQSLPQVQSMIGKTLHKTKVNEAVQGINPALAHPVGQVFLEGIMPRLEAKFPKATPAELAQHASDLFTQFTQTFAPTKQENTAPPEPDWAAWLGDEL